MVVMEGRKEEVWFILPLRRGSRFEEAKNLGPSPSLPFTREVTTAIFRLSRLPWKSKDGAREGGIPALQRGKRDEV